MLADQKFLFSSSSVLAIFLIGCHSASVTVSPDFSLKKYPRIAVLTFDSPAAFVNTELVWSERFVDKAGEAVADQLAAELTGIPGIHIIERSKLNQLLNEQDLTQSEIISTGKLDLAGKVLGVNAIVIGNVHELVHHQIAIIPICKAAFSARCLDVTTAEVLWTITSAQHKHCVDPIGLCRDSIHDGVTQLRQHFINNQPKMD